MSVDFLDTNVILYMFERKDARKRDVARHLVGRALDTGTGVISHQVVQECLHGLTKYSHQPTRDEASTLLDEVLVPLWRVMPTPDLYRGALAVRERYGFHFFDALILSGAIEYGCSRLLTEDLPHGQRVEGVLVENPFLG